MHAMAFDAVFKGEDSEVLTETTLTQGDVLCCFTGSTRAHVTGFSKSIDIAFTTDVDSLHVSTCFLEARFPLMFKCGTREYELQAKGRASSAKACYVFNSWVLQGPG